MTNFIDSLYRSCLGLYHCSVTNGLQSWRAGGGRTQLYLNMEMLAPFNDTLSIQSNRSLETSWNCSKTPRLHSGSNCPSHQTQYQTSMSDLVSILAQHHFHTMPYYFVPCRKQPEIIQDVLFHSLEKLYKLIPDSSESKINANIKTKQNQQQQKTTQVLQSRGIMGFLPPLPRSEYCIPLGFYSLG